MEGYILMKKRFLINTLVLLFSFSAFAVKPNVQQNKKKRAPIARQNTQKVKPAIQAHDDTINEQIETPTFGESWSKVARFEWTSLSKNDAWNIGATLITCGAIAYLYNYMQKNPIANNAINNPHDNQGPDNGNRIHIPIPKPQVINNPVPVIIPVVLPTNKDHNHDQPYLIPVIENHKDKTCDVCLEDKKGHAFCTLSCCGHNTSCLDCLAEMMDRPLKEKITAEFKCPNRNCLQPIKEQDLRKITHTHPDLYKTYHDVAAQEWIDKNTKHCPTPDCPYAFVNDAGHRQSTTCPTCKYTYCSNCCVEHSMEKTCDQAKEDLKLKENKNKENQANDEWLQNNTKACPQCKAPVEKNGGCLTLLCARCQHQFCWNCLKPHDHTERHPCGLWENDAQMNQANQDLIQRLANDNLQHIHNPANEMNNGNFGNLFLNNILQNMMNNIEANQNDLRMRQAQLDQQLQNNRVNIGNVAQNRNNNNVNANRPNNNGNAQNNNRPAVNANNVNRPVANKANAKPANNANAQNNRQGAQANNANRAHNNANANRNAAAKGVRK